MLLRRQRSFDKWYSSCSTTLGSPPPFLPSNSWSIHEHKRYYESKTRIAAPLTIHSFKLFRVNRVLNQSRQYSYTGSVFRRSGLTLNLSCLQWLRKVCRNVFVFSHNGFECYRYVFYIDRPWLEYRNSTPKSFLWKINNRFVIGSILTHLTKCSFITFVNGIISIQGKRALIKDGLPCLALESEMIQPRWTHPEAVVSIRKLYKFTKRAVNFVLPYKMFRKSLAATPSISFAKGLENEKRIGQGGQ